MMATKVFTNATKIILETLTQMRIKIEAMYLDWLNNFITLDAFADYYEISKFKALRVIKIGRQLNGF